MPKIEPVIKPKTKFLKVHLNLFQNGKSAQQYPMSKILQNMGQLYQWPQTNAFCVYQNMAAFLKKFAKIALKWISSIPPCFFQKRIFLKIIDCHPQPHMGTWNHAEFLKKKLMGEFQENVWTNRTTDEKTDSPLNLLNITFWVYTLLWEYQLSRNITTEAKRHFSVYQVQECK